MPSGVGHVAPIACDVARPYPPAPAGATPGATPDGDVALGAFV